MIGILEAAPEDFSLIDLQCELERKADADGGEKCRTLGTALSMFNRVLGETAYIRKGPNDLRTRYQGTVYSCVGLPHRYDAAIGGLKFLKDQMEAESRGVESRLKHVYVSDEGTMEASKELNSGTGHISPFKRTITQQRYLGIGTLIGSQVLSELIPSVKNNSATFCGFRCPNPREAREAAQILGLGEEAIQELQNLPVGVAYVRSEGFSRPVKIRVPLMGS